MVTMAEDRETIVQKGLSEWWSEETEYVFQRIERWAAFARGYNRLPSQRWFKNRQTTQESSDEATPRFYSLKRSRRNLGSEETKINCCGTFNYQSNSKLDSNCLETYRYDHSIYFKTIGDIKSDKKDLRDEDEEKISISSEELVEWDCRSVSSLIDIITDKSISEETRNNNRMNDLNIADTIIEREKNRTMQNAWPIVDLSKLDLNLMNSRGRDERLSRPVDRGNYGKDERQLENNNIDSSKMDKVDNENRKDGSKGHERVKRFRSFQKSRRSSRNVRRPPIVGENNVVWPGILLNYTNNFAGSPHE